MTDEDENSFPFLEDIEDEYSPRRSISRGSRRNRANTQQLAIECQQLLNECGVRTSGNVRRRSSSVTKNGLRSVGPKSSNAEHHEKIGILGADMNGPGTCESKSLFQYETFMATGVIGKSHSTICEAR